MVAPGMASGRLRAERKAALRTDEEFRPALIEAVMATVPRHRIEGGFYHPAMPSTRKINLTCGNCQLLPVRPIYGCCCYSVEVVLGERGPGERKRLLVLGMAQSDVLSAFRVSEKLDRALLFHQIDRVEVGIREHPEMHSEEAPLEFVLVVDPEEFVG